MTTVILVSHGPLAEAFLRTVEAMLGPLTDVHALSLAPGTSPDIVAVRIRSILSEVGTGGALLMVDLFGGSPFNACVELLGSDRRLEMVSGVNLPMLLEVVLSSAESAPSELAALAVRCGRPGIVNVRRMWEERDTRLRL